MSNIWGDRCIFPEHSLNKRKNSAGRVAHLREIAGEEGTYIVPAKSEKEMEILKDLVQASTSHFRKS